MKKVFSVLSAIIFSAFISDCSSNDTMHTNDGITIVSDGKPKIANQTGMR